MTQDPQHAPWDRPDRSDQPGGDEPSASSADQQHGADRSWSAPQPPTSQQPVEPTAASGPPSYGPPSYEQPPSGQPASEQASYGQASYGQPSYGQPGGYAGGPAQPPAGYGYGYGGAPVAPTAPAPVSTIVLLVLSGLATLFTITFLVGAVYIAPLVLSIMALNRRHDPEGARRLTKTGWIIFAVATGLFVLLLVLFFGVIAAGIFSGFSEGASYGSSV